MRSCSGLSALAVSSLLQGADVKDPLAPKTPDHTPTAKSVIWLFMNGGQSQVDTWDYKPQLKEFFDKDLPDSIRNGQRITTMTSGQARFPVAPSMFKFTQHGRCGLLPQAGWPVAQHEPHVLTTLQS